MGQNIRGFRVEHWTTNEATLLTYMYLQCKHQPRIEYTRVTQGVMGRAEAMRLCFLTNSFTYVLHAASSWCLDSGLDLQFT